MSALKRLAKSIFGKEIREEDFDLVRTLELPDYRKSAGTVTEACFYFARRNGEGTYDLFQAVDEFKPQKSLMYSFYTASRHGDNLDAKTAIEIAHGLPLSQALQRLDAQEAEMFTALPDNFAGDKVLVLPDQHTSAVRRALNLEDGDTEDEATPAELRQLRKFGF